MDSGREARIEEMQGWEGPYSLSELVLQQVWSRGDFLREGLRVEDGRSVVVAAPGAWNHSAGPDFRGAEIYLDGVRHLGDVEVHLRAGDWRVHGHASDPAYSGVVLHVVLFPPKEPWSEGWGGHPLPVLALLPHLLHDLEDYAMDYALERLAPKGLGQERCDGPEDVAYWARRQFALRVDRARSRIQAWGWAEAAHASALDVLGYALNRHPMVELARHFPYAAGRWPVGREALGRMMSQVSGWAVRGRPANHPGLRVQQYATWWNRVPDWPERLREVALPGRVPWRDWAPDMQAGWGAVEVGDTRWSTWLLEGALPLLGAMDQRESAFQLWGSAPAAEADARTLAHVRAWRRTAGQNGPLTHAELQAWRGWHAHQAQVEGERGGEGLDNASRRGVNGG